MNHKHYTGVYTKTTEGIKVSVMPEYLDHSSDPERGLYMFAYTITIENLGEASVQLLERHWMLNSGGETIAEIVGAGVVGEQPVLGSGGRFEYTSAAVIQDPEGSIEGMYVFRTDDGGFFEVMIPEFDLCSRIVFH
ncbi:MAG: Co2+/Mg2+ efflux protein ApaG [Bdellovibrionales bacterium]|nr:Co2+/Mg2+ efflux protein ApaG [Bdellovibrionales bacterium]